MVYPRFETRGDLRETVTRFREWLQNKVIDVEVAHNTPSPTVDPSVHVVLVGHSMGGIVAAETYLLLASEQPLPTSSSAMNPETPNFPSNTTLGSSTGSSHPHPPTSMPDTSATLMFPHIQAVIAFDTPFLGLAPSMVASQVEGGHQIASTAYNTYTEATKLFGWNTKPETGASAIGSAKALPAPATSPLEDAAAAPKWQSWGKVAMFAGAAGAVAAGGAAALYSQREKISAGWGWASSHLLFVGDLVRAENLKRRVDMLEKATGERGGSCANLYTNLGKGKREGTVTGDGGRRTFCNLPAKATGKGRPEDSARGMKWLEAVNDKARDEISAHCSMFTPRDNPNFYALGEKAKACVVESVDQTWYAGSEKNVDGPHPEGAAVLGDGEAWEKADPDAEEQKWEGVDAAVDNDGTPDGEDVKMTESYEGLQRRGKDGPEELEDSVIVDKASHGQVPLPGENPWAN